MMLMWLWMLHGCRCPCVPVCPHASAATRASDFIRTSAVCLAPFLHASRVCMAGGICACLCACGRGWCWCLYVCPCLWRGSFCMSACAGACICIWCFRVHMCVRVHPPVHFPSLDPHPPGPSGLSLISGGPACCGHQGTAGLCWVPPNSTSPPSTSTSAASPSPVSLLPFCPLLLCPSSSVCSPEQACSDFLPLSLGPLP